MSSSHEGHPHRFEIVRQQLAGIAGEMGVVLVRSALSANIRERRDSSTALFDSTGRLVAQAAHIPVHLGSMDRSVEAVIDAGARPGELWILNDPWAGGTHLPDITAVTAIEDSRTHTTTAWAAARAHHADVGGDVPGSMSATARSVLEEGILIPPQRIGTITTERCDLDETLVSSLVQQMRQPHERRGDLLAQAAALQVALRQLPRVQDAVGGAQNWHSLCGLARASARSRFASLLDRYSGCTGSAERELELPGNATARIVCHIDIASDGVRVDFSGSSPQSPTSLNCVASVTRAATLFAIATTLDGGATSTVGLDEIVRIEGTNGSVIMASHPAAVAAGNVEVSSAVFDVVVDALACFLDAPASGAGTMANIVFGNDRFSWYETIGGGQGARATGDGPSGTHVAMTNTLNTPIESIERESPLRILEYGIRTGSGGAGHHRGGDGIIRTFQVLEPCTLSVLMQRTRSAASGRHGADSGIPGRVILNGVEIDGCTTTQLEAGDVVTVETPGGGGWNPSGPGIAQASAG